MGQFPRPRGSGGKKRSPTPPGTQLHRRKTFFFFFEEGKVPEESSRNSPPAAKKSLFPTGHSDLGALRSSNKYPSITGAGSGTGRVAKLGRLKNRKKKHRFWKISLSSPQKSLS